MNISSTYNSQIQVYKNKQFYNNKTKEIVVWIDQLHIVTSSYWGINIKQFNTEWVFIDL